MSNYAKAYKEMVKKGTSIEELNTANHLALETGKITLKEFQEAARILALEILNR
jgi:hypothetical protein